ncbi:MAG: hypothetical protein B7Y25_08380 [Alphaproteobacteria bacterium 16-39-46]|nr:MAG: hypothetical protein B7Y25_08380 [Alphaproteobacteria bacterium 16-39-46]OZA41103.1 MAG: hypothetical protein B7X84_08560 [Alphaproteobacteria bacterium 17-39-52]HQS84896.1 nucleotidyl transferase AbiEii/AbiGii toxin family protein [Alphaproteobacteria bacterium]HQS94661.1 nucleotidyl transferase AbiEii/AbiGii toxin family protein [Alphaproteobacteria bacterium]
MIKKTELLNIQKIIKLPLSTIEKDYVLSLLIWAISQNKNLKNEWVFKGGTCLKKCYFGDYRFSEDLDYTLVPKASIHILFIKEELLSCFVEIYNNFGIRFESKDLILSPFPDKMGLFIQIKIPYQGLLLSSGSLPRIKIDLSQEEIIVQTPVKLPLLHNYSDSLMCETDVTCYSLYEIFSEKLRALVQRARPRDLYDVVHLGELFETQNFDKNILKEVAHKKFEYKGLRYPRDLHEISKQTLEDTKNDWNIMLSHQVRDLAEMDIYLNKFNQLAQKILV